jgi:hypothetical protein
VALIFQVLGFRFHPSAFDFCFQLLTDLCLLITDTQKMLKADYGPRTTGRGENAEMLKAETLKSGLWTTDH